MSEDRDGLIAHYHRMRDAFIDAIEGLSDTQMTETTIDGWSVKDHLLHIALWDDIRADEVRRLSAGFESAWRLGPEEDGVLNEMMYAARRWLSLDQARWEFSRSRERLLDALVLASPEALDSSRYGEAGLVSRHEEQHAGWIRAWRERLGY